MEQKTAFAFKKPSDPPSEVDLTLLTDEEARLMWLPIILAYRGIMSRLIGAIKSDNEKIFAHLDRLVKFANEDKDGIQSLETELEEGGVVVLRLTLKVEAVRDDPNQV